MKTQVIFRDNSADTHFNIRRVEYRNENGTLDRPSVGLPAILTYDVNGKVELEEYYSSGLRHNQYGPAIIYYKDGVFVREEYWVNGKLLLQLDPGQKLEIAANIAGQVMPVPQSRLVEFLQLLKS